MMRRIGVTFLLILLLTLTQAWAQNAGQGDEIRVKSGTLTDEQQHSVVTATGNAVATKGDMTIPADSISVNQNTNELSASGNVEVKDLRGVVKSEALRL